MLTRISYLYRDAANYKFRGHFVVTGAIRKEALAPFLFDREWFVPETVGVASLRPRDIGEDDHLLHEIEKIEPVIDGEPICTAGEFVARIKASQRQGYFR